MLTLTYTPAHLRPVRTGARGPSTEPLGAAERRKAKRDHLAACLVSIVILGHGAWISDGVPRLLFVAVAALCAIAALLGPVLLDPSDRDPGDEAAGGEVAK